MQRSGFGATSGVPFFSLFLHRPLPCIGVLFEFCPNANTV
jgi:hypothetical protein